MPLQRDLEAHQRRLRLKVSADDVELDLDLRNATDLERSRLLHRLVLLGIPWGKPVRGKGQKAGSFHEYWKLQWQVEFPVALIEANVWGNTVAAAATGKARHVADDAADLPTLSKLLDAVLLAELAEALEAVLARLQEQAAVAADVRHLMDAMPALAEVMRYSDVRKTPVERLTPVLAGMFERIVVGLPGACASLDDDAAGTMIESFERVQASLDLLDRAAFQAEWLAVLGKIEGRDGVHGLVRGKCCRLRLEKGAIDEPELQRLAGLALSPAVPAPQAAAWIDGLVRGSGMVLLHRDGLWQALDAWLVDLSAETFTELLPFLRRAFSGFAHGERRAMGEKVRDLTHAGAKAAPPPADFTDLHPARAAAVLPILAHILGTPWPPPSAENR